MHRERNLSFPHTALSPPNPPQKAIRAPGGLCSWLPCYNPVDASSDSDDGGKNIVVVIAVLLTIMLIAGLIGFLVHRYWWKRRRSEDDTSNSCDDSNGINDLSPPPRTVREWVDTLQSVLLPPAGPQRNALGLRQVDVCSVCCLLFGAGEEVRVLPCGVVLHRDCAVHFFEQFGRCPLGCDEARTSV